MKTLIAAAALAALTVPALAGDHLAKWSKKLSLGYRCETACPLAQEANWCRSFGLGLEALRSSPLVRADVSRVVVANLDRI